MYVPPCNVRNEMNVRRRRGSAEDSMWIRIACVHMYLWEQCCGRQTRMTSSCQGLVRSAGECRGLHLALYLNRNVEW